MPLLPNRLSLWLTSIVLVIGIATAWQPDWLVWWQNALVFLIALLIIDALLAWRIPPIEIKRSTGQALPVGEWHTIELRLQWASEYRGRSLHGQINDMYPDAFESTTMPQNFVLHAGEHTTLQYQVRPLQRGDHPFQATLLRLTSPLHLWQRQVRINHTQTLRVYPDFAKVTQYALLATDNRLSQIGVLLKRRRGEGLDFHQLREYREGDTPRQIDWKATARHGKLVSREYQDERDQRIIFMLDCGQRMRAKESIAEHTANQQLPLSHFDHTLNAMLLLAYVALRQGDAVGLSTFAHGEDRYLAPRKSVQHVNRILSSVYHLEPTLAPPDYLTACESVYHRLDKRSLIILLTNLRDEDSSPLLPALQLLRKKHLVLLANLRESSFDLLQQRPIQTFDDALTYAAGVEYTEARRKTFATLRHAGVHLLDTPPAQLPIRLVNQYWDLKRTGLM